VSATDDDQLKAISLILRGDGGWDDFEKKENERLLVLKYFGSVTSSDVRSALSEFEHSTASEARWEVARLLMAWFNWCWATELTKLPDGSSVDEFFLHFAKVSFLRILGAPLQTETGNEYPGLLPKWRRPDVAFGAEKPNHRLPEDNFIRDLIIAMNVELLRRKHVELADAKRRTAMQFRVSLDVVIKSITVGNKAGFGRRFSRIKTQELEAGIKDFINTNLEKSMV
jgi:hypothetical protein